MLDIKEFENRIICGDCLEIMGDLPDKSIDLCLTDPPYGIGKEGVVNDENLEQFNKVLPEIYRVMKDNTWFVTFFSSELLPQAFINNPFKYVWLGFIYYSNAQRIMHCRCGKSKQSTYLVFEKGHAKRCDFIFDVQHYVYGGDNKMIKHTALKPLESIEILVRGYSKKDAIVLDPFVGSGTTALACKRLNRRYIGIEINPDYYELSRQRLMNIPNHLDSYASHPTPAQEPSRQAGHDKV